MKVRDLPTLPSLVVDVGTLDANIATMAAARLVALRPRVKAFKVDGVEPGGRAQGHQVLLTHTEMEGMADARLGDDLTCCWPTRRSTPRLRHPGRPR